MNKTKPVVPVEIEITDIITPKSCSFFVAELIKFIAYNKQQIPYPYDRLKMFVMKREHQKNVELLNSQKESTTSYRDGLLMEKHYKKVEEAYQILNNTFKCIEHELMQSSEQPIEEIVLLFGATPISPKDVYRIQIPSLLFGHCESQHIWRKQVGNLFREIIVSDEVNMNLQKKVGLTNMFVMIKMKKGEWKQMKEEWLLPKDQYRLPNGAQQVYFSFRTLNPKPCSCFNRNELEKLTQDMTALSIRDVVVTSDTVSDSVWYQTSRTLKGFKDCKLKGKSITDLWFGHKFL